jgi:hypothetical protein
MTARLLSDCRALRAALISQPSPHLPAVNLRSVGPKDKSS